MNTVTLKKLSHNARLSEETHCFSADVYIDGVKVGEVSNRGRGGPDDFYPRDLQGKLDKIAETLPRMCTKYNVKNDAELLIGGLVDDYLLTKELKKLLSKRILFTKADGKIYQTKVLTPEQISRVFYGVNGEKQQFINQNGVTTILNTLPFSAALIMFRAQS